MPVQGAAAPAAAAATAPDAAASATAAAGVPELGSAAPDSAAAEAPELGSAAPDSAAAGAPELDRRIKFTYIVATILHLSYLTHAEFIHDVWDEADALGPLERDSVAVSLSTTEIGSYPAWKL